MASTSAIEMILEMASRLAPAEQLQLAHTILGRCLGVASALPTAKATKAKVAKDPDAPKREGNWWIKATQHVREILKPLLEEDNKARAAEGQSKIPGTAPTTVSSMLKDAGKLSKEELPSEEDVLEAYESYKISPPAPKSKGSDSESAASKGSKASSKKSDYASLSEEEKAARRSEAAKKAAATRAANKAKKAAEALVEVAEEVNAAAAVVSAKDETDTLPDDDAEAEDAVEDVWTHKGKSYRRVNGIHLWEAATNKWVGDWDEAKQTINRKAKEPEFADE